MIKQIESYKDLKEGWNGYDVPVIDRGAIRQAINHVKQLKAVGQDIFFVAPTPEGAILIELKNKDRHLEYYFFDDEVMYLICWDGMDCVRVPTSEAIKWLNEKKRLIQT